MGFIAPILSAVGAAAAAAAPYVAGAAALGSAMHPPTPQVAQPSQALQDQATVTQAPPTQESIVGNDAETVLNRLRTRRQGAMGLQQTNVTGGVAGQAPVQAPGVSVRTPSTPMAGQTGGYQSNKKLVGE